jgi:transposase InsO family protein
VHAIHPNARTTPAVRAEIARSTEPSGVLAKRYGVSTETVRKWRKRGPADCLDRSARPHKLPWKASEDERQVVCDLRRFTELPLDELSFVVRHFLPHLDRDAVYRILRAEGLNRLPRRPEGGRKKGTGTFRTYDLGFVHMDVKHLPKLQTADGERRKRFLFVAIDRCSRSVHLAVKDEGCEATATAFLREVVERFPFRISHVLTDRGSCLAADGFEAACRELGIEHRRTKPYTPQTNGMAERFNRRIQDEVLCLTIHSHAALEHLLKGFAPAYNARRQRVLDGLSPNEVVCAHLEVRPRLANPRFKPPNPCAVTRSRIDALCVVEHAKEVSHPDSPGHGVSPCSKGW